MESFRYADKLKLPKDNDNWVNEYSNISEIKLFSLMSDLFHKLTWSAGLQQVCDRMLEHFRHGYENDFGDSFLNKEVANNIYFLR